MRSGRRAGRTGRRWLEGRGGPSRSSRLGRRESPPVGGHDRLLVGGWRWQIEEKRMDKLILVRVSSGLIVAALEADRGEGIPRQRPAANGAPEVTGVHEDVSG